MNLLHLGLGAAAVWYLFLRNQAPAGAPAAGSTPTAPAAVPGAPAPVPASTLTVTALRTADQSSLAAVQQAYQTAVTGGQTQTVQTTAGTFTAAPTGQITRLPTPEEIRRARF